MNTTEVSTVPKTPPRPDDAHKGTFGTVVVVGGSPTMIGAPALAATAALRAGAGLVKIMTHPVVIPFCLAVEPSATGLYPNMETMSALFGELRENVVLAVGPGMSTGGDEQAAVAALLKLGRPMVLDADGLNNLTSLGASVKKMESPLVLTPHAGEYRRLAHASGLEFDPTDPSQRPEAAAALAERYGAVVVLKGRGTVVCDGARCYTNTTGNPALATAGTGDVLTGVIAGLMAQGMEAFDAAVLGVHVHGLAADLWADRHGRAGLLARDLASLIPDALEARRRST